ncbi:hypothetical protein EON77_07160 [bacterium]|nr:MAG: hypothetical protein EON77_07160 [bacterium]
MENKKYSEAVVRHPAVDPDGHPCEILERVTFEHDVAADGSVGEPRQLTRRYDLRTGQRMNHLGDDLFECDLTGERYTRVPADREGH